MFILDTASGEAGYIFRLERAKDAESIMAIYHEFLSRIPEEKFNLLRRSIRTWLGRLVQKKNRALPDSADKGEQDILEEKFRRWEQEFYENGGIAGKAEGLGEVEAK